MWTIVLILAIGLVHSIETNGEMEERSHLISSISKVKDTAKGNFEGPKNENTNDFTTKLDDLDLAVTILREDIHRLMAKYNSESDASVDEGNPFGHTVNNNEKTGESVNLNFDEVLRLLFSYRNDGDKKHLADINKMLEPMQKTSKEDRKLIATPQENVATKTSGIAALNNGKTLFNRNEALLKLLGRDFHSTTNCLQIGEACGFFREPCCAIDKVYKTNAELCCRRLASKSGIQPLAKIQYGICLPSLGSQWETCKRY